MRERWKICVLREPEKNGCVSKWICSIAGLKRRLLSKSERSRNWKEPRLRRSCRFLSRPRVLVRIFLLPPGVRSRVSLTIFGTLPCLVVSLKRLSKVPVDLGALLVASLFPVIFLDLVLAVGKVPFWFPCVFRVRVSFPLY